VCVMQQTHQQQVVAEVPRSLLNCHSRSSGRSLTLASGDGNTSGGSVNRSVNMKGRNGATDLGGYITISSHMGTATSSGRAAISMSNAGVSSGVYQVICV
jgi:hypothetical protein